MKEKLSIEQCLRPGWYMYWQKQVYRIIDCDKKNLIFIHVENIVTSEQRAIRLETLWLPTQEDQSIPLFAPTLERLYHEIDNPAPEPEMAPESGIPDKLLQRADRIISVVEKMQETTRQMKLMITSRGDKYSHAEALKQAGALFTPPIGLATYYEYLDRYQKCHGDRVQIAASLRRSTYNQTRLSQAQLHFLDTMIPLYYREDCQSKPMRVYRLANSALAFHTQGYWIDPCKCPQNVPEDLLDELIRVLRDELPMQMLLENAEKAKCLTKINMPSRGFFYEYIRWFEALPDQGRRTMNSRYGEGTWEKFYMVFDTFAHQATYPLQYVFADHYLLDVFIVDEATRSKLDRLWLTVLIDAYSRCILGVALLYEEPCIESIQSALLHAIWPKTSHRDRGIDGEWICYGIPHQLYLDNAWAHHSHSLENLARAIGQGGKYHSIDLVFRPPYKARYGALIENFFGNLSSRIRQELPGAIQSSNSKDVQKAVKKACLLYEDVYRYIQQVILQYQHKDHKALGGMTPHEKWMEGMQAGWPQIPPLTPSVKRLFLRMNHDTRQINGKGISAFGLNYSSSALDAAEIIGRDGQAVQYSFRYDPSDISRLALFREDHWVGDIFARELKLPDGTVKPTSLWELRLAKAIAKARQSDTHDWLAYLNTAERLGKKRKAERDKVRRTVKNMTKIEEEEVYLEQSEDELEEIPLNDDEYQTKLLVDFES
jgi:hypothetical protein